MAQRTIADAVTFRRSRASSRACLAHGTTGIALAQSTFTRNGTDQLTVLPVAAVPGGYQARDDGRTVVRSTSGFEHRISARQGVAWSRRRTL